jgi:hypothetical protein
MPLHIFAGRQDPFMPFAMRLEDAGATLHWFDGGHLSGFVPDVMDSVVATVAELSTSSA